MSYQHPARKIFIGSAIVIVILCAALVWIQEAGPQKKRPLVVYCGAGLRPAVEQIAKSFKASTGLFIDFQYGPSETLLISAGVSKVGDLFLPGDDSYIREAQSKGLVNESFPLARMKPILVVKKGNPHGISKFEDLLRSDVKVSQVNPDTAAAGKLVRTALQQIGKWDAISKKTTTFTLTVNDVANSVKLGATDAGFIWDSLLKQYPELEAVTLPEILSTDAHLAVCILKSTAQPEAARKFINYLAAPDDGLKVFKDYGFNTEAAPSSASEASSNINTHAVLWSGSMKQVLMDGDVSGHISLDSLSSLPHLYALGPLEGLKGEISIFDSIPSIARVVNQKPTIDHQWSYKAAFLVYSQVDRWQVLEIPEAVRTVADIDGFIAQSAKSVHVDSTKPFPFLIKGNAATVDLHVVLGADAVKAGQMPTPVPFSIENKPVEMIGFYSQNHQGVFTHHGMNLHIHVRTTDDSISGHVVEMKLQPGCKLYLPAN